MNPQQELRKQIERTSPSYLLAQAEAEVARLREALQKIADGADSKAFVKATALKALAGTR